MVVRVRYIAVVPYFKNKIRFDIIVNYIYFFVLSYNITHIQVKRYTVLKVVYHRKVRLQKNVCSTHTAT